MNADRHAVSRLPAPERTLAEAEEERRRIAAVLDSLPANIALLDCSGRIVGVNEAWRWFSRENGLRYVGAEVGTNYVEVCRRAAALSAEGAGQVAEWLTQVLSGARRSFTVDYPCHSSSERRWFRLHASTLNTPGGGAVVMHTDITEDKLAAEAARLATKAVRYVAEGVLVIDSAMRVVTTNQAFCRMTAYTSGEVTDCELKLFLADACVALLIERIASSAVQRHGSWKGDILLRRKDGGLLPANISVAAVRGDSRGSEHFVLVLNDLSAQQDYQRKLDHVSRHDPLTGLPNRTALAEHVRLIIANAQGYPELAVLVVIGLDRFKLVNDSLGHRTGDALLQAAAARLRQALPSGEILARLSGDEFALMVTSLSRRSDGEARAQEIRSALNAAFPLDGRALFVTASLGLSYFPDDGVDFETLLHKAGLAMRKAKAAGGNALSSYACGMEGGQLEQLTLQSDLQLALERNEFLLQFQPTLDLTTGEVVSAEALVRWQHPVLGLLGPDRFVAAAEETGAIGRLGDWVLRGACAAAVRWGQEGLESVGVAVNLSARQFELGDLAARIRAVLRETGLEPGRLRLEVTEGMVMADPQTARHTLSELAVMGIHIALDDFGTGYSSLGYLQQFQLDCLKIDRCFVKEIPGNESSNAIARAVVALGNALGLRVVAEGIETGSQLMFLQEAGCHEVQGYLFCTPVSASELRRWALGRKRVCHMG
jgi:diguanylate cyclase (GGDEF)-like protein/PAS domain S-box-containing protein